jgi:hypothetical protein
MAKKKANIVKKAARPDKAASVLPGLPGTFVVMGLGSKKNAAVAAAIRKKLGGG